jgi:hypothetical protein
MGYTIVTECLDDRRAWKAFSSRLWRLRSTPFNTQSYTLRPHVVIMLKLEVGFLSELLHNSPIYHATITLHIAYGTTGLLTFRLVWQMLQCSVCSLIALNGHDMRFLSLHLS